MNVGFIHQHDRTLGLVLDQIFDIGMTGQRAGRIVRAADIEHARIGSRSQHRLHIVRVGLRQRNFHDFRADGVGGEHAGFVSGIGGDIAALRGSECRHRVMQRLARPGIDADLFQLQPFHFGQRLHQIVGEIVGIASALRDDGGNGLARRSARPERVFVGVNADRILRKIMHASVSQHRLGHDAQGQRRRGGSRQAEKRTAGCGRKGRLVVVCLSCFCPGIREPWLTSCRQSYRRPPPNTA